VNVAQHCFHAVRRLQRKVAHCYAFAEVEAHYFYLVPLNACQKRPMYSIQTHKVYSQQKVYSIG
jgi:hypothetical protein